VLRRAPRQYEARAVKGLNRVDKRWAVAFFENIPPDLHNVIRTDAKEVTIESCVMKLAQGKAVPNDRLSFRLGIANDVSGIEKLFVPQPAERALMTICIENSLPKGALVKALADSGGDVSSARRAVLTHKAVAQILVDA
jgi:hypothetical protein